jgi:hypothetical protein
MQRSHGAESNHIFVKKATHFFASENCADRRHPGKFSTPMAFGRTAHSFSQWSNAIMGMSTAVASVSPATINVPFFPNFPQQPLAKATPCELVSNVDSNA